MTDPALSASQALIDATEVHQAQVAASEVVDLALDGGCALSEASANIVGWLAAGRSRAVFPAYLLAVLISIGRWIGVWQRLANLGEASAQVELGVERERLAARALGEIVLGSMQSPLPADLEERSLVYRLCGVACPDSASALAWLLEAARVETNVSAKAVLAEAVAVVLARGDSSPAAPAMDWLRDVLRSDTTGEVLLRLAIAPHDFVGSGVVDNRRRICELIGAELPADGYSAMWPSELL